jgi:putative transposase
MSVRPFFKSQFTSMKAYKYRLYADKATTERLQWILDRCRELYNAALDERKSAYRIARKSIGYYEQKRDLVEIKESICPEYQDIASHVLQDVILRVKRAYDHFFRRVKNGEQPGYPRFQGSNRYDSFTYPDGAGWKLDAKERPAGKKGMVRVKLHLSKIGTVKLHLHRDMAGTIKTLTIKREGEHWYACFSCEISKPEALPVVYEDVGIDLGVAHFAALSTGEFLDHPRYFRKTEKKLKQLQAALSRKQCGSHRRKKAVQAVAAAHRKIRNQRRDFQHKASRKLVNRYQVIALEDLRVKNLTRAPAPFKTSQRCSQCHKEGPHKDLDERVHRCVHCGVVLDRDINAAINILQAAYKQLLVGTRPTRATA